MGWITNYVAYRIGRRVQRSNEPRPQAQTAFIPQSFDDEPECINFDSFCKNYGSCDGQVCEYE